MSLIVTMLIGAGIIYWYNNGMISPLAPQQAGAAFPNRMKLPLILNDDRLEKSMIAQKQTNTGRLPLGPPNPFQYTIDDPSFLMSNPNYPKYYQRNIRNVSEIRTEDWRVDPKFNSPYNNYASLHMPENSLDSISKWGN